MSFAGDRLRFLMATHRIHGISSRAAAGGSARGARAHGRNSIHTPMKQLQVQAPLHGLRRAVFHTAPSSPACLRLPINNLIPEWTTSSIGPMEGGYEASQDEQLPEFTGRVCQRRAKARASRHQRGRSRSRASSAPSATRHRGGLILPEPRWSARQEGRRRRLGSGRSIRAAQPQPRPGIGSPSSSARIASAASSCMGIPNMKLDKQSSSAASTSCRRRHHVCYQHGDRQNLPGRQVAQEFDPLCSAGARRTERLLFTRLKGAPSRASIRMEFLHANTRACWTRP